MKKMKMTLLAASTALLSLGVVANAAAEDASALATKNNCTTCHRVKTSDAAPLLGPSYEEVAAKYKGQEGALEQLSAKVKAGGDGNWDTQLPMMPPNAAVSDEDIKAIVSWILTL